VFVGATAVAAVTPDEPTTATTVAIKPAMAAMLANTFVFVLMMSPVRNG